MNLRPYQLDAVNALWGNAQNNCIISLPTGSGKSLVVAELVRRCCEFDGTHVLILQHKRELIQQNAKHIAMLLPMNIEIGVYCAGLREKKQRQVTLASVQSLAKVTDLLPFEVIIVDEAHLIPHGDDGQYRALFARLPNAKIWGLSATPYRMKSGLLHKGEDALFSHLVYESKTGDLIDQGFLSPIIAKQTSESADLSSVHVRGGEFIENEMQAAMDKEAVTKAAVSDVLKLAESRKSILVFASGLEHADHVKQAFIAAGQTSITIVTQKTSMHDRDNATKDFREGLLRILVNVGCFTTGFDAPNVNCIVLLRATKSPGLYVQCVGRGLRKADGKDNCLLLDYGNNILTHGPLDMITAQRATNGTGVAPVKTCPECGSIIFAGCKTCPDCGYLFPREEKESPKHGTQASDIDPIKPTVINEYNVLRVEYDYHKCKSGKPAMRVDYILSFINRVSEYIMPETIGFPQQKAQAWFARRGVSPMPRTVEDCLDIADYLLWPKRIAVKEGGKFPEIVMYKDWQKSKATIKQEALLDAPF